MNPISRISLPEGTFGWAFKTRVDLIAGRRESNGVFKGDNNYLLEDIAKPNQEQMKQNLKAIREFEKEYKDIPMYMMLGSQCRQYSFREAAELCGNGESGGCF